MFFVNLVPLRTLRACRTNTIIETNDRDNGEARTMDVQLAKEVMQRLTTLGGVY